MRDRFFRIAALILGVLIVPSLVWQIWGAWPLDQLELYFFGGQALILYIFLSFGLGIGPMTPGYLPSQPKPSEGADSADA